MSLNVFPKHPFPMETIFKTCYLANFGMEPSVLRRLLPAPIEPDIYKGKAYLSIVISDLSDMRPTFLPKGFGFNFNQIVYRAIVTCNGERGVHFLRSDADNRLMCLAGNLFSFFRFNYAEIENIKNKKINTVTVRTDANEADISASFDISKAEKNMPASSVFDDLNEAKKYFAELYVAFSTLPKYSTAVRIRRTNWDVSLVSDDTAKYNFMDGSEMFPSGSTRLDSVFYVENLFYHWNTLEKSRIEP